MKQQITKVVPSRGTAVRVRDCMYVYDRDYCNECCLLYVECLVNCSVSYLCYPGIVLLVCLKYPDRLSLSLLCIACVALYIVRLFVLFVETVNFS